MPAYKNIVQEWLNSKLLNESEKQEILNLSNKEQKEIFKLTPFKFGTGGIRKLTGIGPQKLNRFTYRLLGIAYANYLKSKNTNLKAIVVHDNREFGAEYCLEVATTLQKLGIDVYVAPNNIAISTPILSYLIRNLKMDGGVNITASHNPPEYNGFKIYNSLGQQLEKNEEKIFLTKAPTLKGVEQLNNEFNTELKHITQKQLDLFFQEIKKNFSFLNIKNSSEKYLFNSHGGTTKENMKKLAKEIGFLNFEELNNEKNYPWNPENKDSFKSAIKHCNGKYVLSADPDGDRSGIAEKQEDGKWYFFNGNEISILISHFKNTQLKIENPYIVTTHLSNNYLKKIFPEVPVHISLPGFKNISKIIEREETKGNNLLIAFEEASSFNIFPIHREKDSYQTTIFLLTMIDYLRSKNLSLNIYLNQIFKKYGYWRGFTEHYEKLKTPIYKVPLLINPPFKEVTKIEYSKNKKTLTWHLTKDSWIKFRNSETEFKLKIYYNLHGNKKEIDEFVSALNKFFKEKLKLKLLPQ